MRLTLLGTGNAAGMPLFGCKCKICMKARSDVSCQRKTSCALLETSNEQYMIDAGLMNLAEQFTASGLDGILLTHFHVDHVQGLFHLRWGIGKKIPVYCPPDSRGCDDLFKHPGILDFRPQRKYESFRLGQLNITPLPLIHSRVTFGYLIENGNQTIAYLVDTKGLPPGTEALLCKSELDVMIIDTTSPPGVVNRNHNNLDETLELHSKIGAKKTIMTHISHELDLWLSENSEILPESVFSCKDGDIVSQ